MKIMDERETQKQNKKNKNKKKTEKKQGSAEPIVKKVRAK